MPNKKSSHFYPPKPNGWVKNFIGLLWPWIHQPLTAGGFDLKVNDADLNRLKLIINQPCFIFPNHPTTTDPLVIFRLGYLLKKNFYFVAAFEHFNGPSKLQRWLLQFMGCYSIIRGKTDKPSFDCTLNIIKNNLGPLVIFAEGEVSNANDIMLPFQEGVVQLAQLSHRQLNKAQQNSSVYLCPVFVQYEYSEAGFEKALLKSIVQLEKQLAITAEKNSPIYDRLLNIGNVLLEAASLELGIALPENRDWPEKRAMIQHSILSKLQGILSITPDENATPIQQVRQIVALVNTALVNEPRSASPFVMQKIKNRNDFLRQFYALTDRVLHFITLYPNYLPPNEINHRYAELVMRYEKEVFGKINFRQSKAAQLIVAEPIELTNETPLTKEQILERIQAFYQQHAKLHETSV